MPRDEFHWLNVERIAEELASRHPESDPLNLNFLELRNLVERLPGFAADPAHPVNERILETIQMLWHEDRDALGGDEEPD